MFDTTTPDNQKRRRLVVVGVALVMLVAAAGLYTALTYTTSSHDHEPSPAGPGSVEAGPPEPASDPRPVDGALPELKPTTDPEAFARLVAHAIFDWDTTVLVPLAGYTDRLVSVADPSGESTPGLVADLTTYLPTVNAWDQLREYSTRQWLTITSVEVPTRWPQTMRQAGPTGLLPGTTAYTITGTRHRAGVWEGEGVASEHEVAFTVFIVCAPSYPACHLLRLSRLDNPLD